MMKKIILSTIISTAILASSAFAQSASANPGIVALLNNIPSANQAPVVLHVHFKKSLNDKAMAAILTNVLGKEAKVKAVSSSVATFRTPGSVLVTCVKNGKSSMSMPGVICSN